MRELDQTIVLAVGTDANIGKMTVMLQLRDALTARGVRAAFAPTGQTGIFIEGWGICVDAVIADFIAGAAEAVTIHAARDADIVLVEGQGSILHPGYSGVSLGLLHGSLPHALIACHQPSRATFRHNSWLPIPPLATVIELHESMAHPLRPTKTIGVSLNTSDLSDRDARAAIDRTKEETGLPVEDPVRDDPGCSSRRCANSIARGEPPSTLRLPRGKREQRERREPVFADIVAGDVRQARGEMWSARLERDRATSVVVAPSARRDAASTTRD